MTDTRNETKHCADCLSRRRLLGARIAAGYAAAFALGVLVAAALARAL